MINSPLKRYFFLQILIFVFWQVSLFLIPVESYLPNPVFILDLNLTFIFTFLLSSLFSSYLLLRIGKVAYPLSYSRIRINSGRRLNFNIYFSSICSILGFFLIFYDRVFIRGIDYTNGLRAARYEWLESGGGSFSSIVGNLMIPLSYVALYFLISYRTEIGKLKILLLVISSSLGIVGHAALNGGRSNILIAAFLCLIIFIFKSKNDFYAKNKYYKKFILLISVLLPILMFVIYLTNQSAQMANISMVELVKLGVYGLYGSPTENFKYIDNDGVAIVVYIFSYLFHGSWTAEALYTLKNSSYISQLPGSYLYYPISVLASSLKIIDSPIELGYFSDSGAFLSLPGAIYYDFGFLGVFIGTFIIGIMVSISVYYLSYKRVTLFGFGLAIYPIIVALMSPILPAYGLMYLNFVVYAYIVMGILNKLAFRVRLHWL